MKPPEFWKKYLNRENISYADFRLLVCRYTPSSLITQIAALERAESSIYRGDLTEEYRRQPPWALSLMVRDSILFEKPYGSIDATPSDVNMLLKAFTIIYDIPSNSHVYDSMINGITYEQSSYQVSPITDLARSLILLGETTTSKRIIQDGWEEVHGVEILDYIKSGIAIYSATKAGKGKFPKVHMIDEEMGHLIKPYVDVESIQKTLRIMTATPQEFREDFERSMKKSNSLPFYLQRGTYNPLFKTPFIDLGGNHLHCPQPHLILEGLKPESLYYAGSKRWKLFPEHAGDLVEVYTGRVLKNIQGVEVRPEIDMGTKDKDLSIDWFMSTKKSVFLIECKVATLNVGVRAGDYDHLKVHNETYLHHAVNQINRTYENMKSGNKKLETISHAGKRIYGIIVTLGPLHAGNGPDTRLLMPPSEIPLLTLSLRELEYLSCMSIKEIEKIFLAFHSEPELKFHSIHVTIDNMIKKGKLPDVEKRHPVLEGALRQILPPGISKEIRQQYIV